MKTYIYGAYGDRYKTDVCNDRLYLKRVPLGDSRPCWYVSLPKSLQIRL